MTWTYRVGIILQSSISSSHRLIGNRRASDDRRAVQKGVSISLRHPFCLPTSLGSGEREYGHHTRLVRLGRRDGEGRIRALSLPHVFCKAQRDGYARMWLIDAVAFPAEFGRRSLSY